MQGPGSGPVRVEPGLARTSSGNPSDWERETKLHWVWKPREECGPVMEVVGSPCGFRSRDMTGWKQSIRKLCLAADGWTGWRNRGRQGCCSQARGLVNFINSKLYRQQTKKTLPFMMMFSMRTSGRQRHWALDKGTHQRILSKYVWENQPTLYPQR